MLQQQQPRNVQRQERPAYGGAGANNNNRLSRANVQALPTARGGQLGAFARHPEAHEQVALGIVSIRGKAHEGKKL